MTTFLYHETMICEVTFVRRIQGDDRTDALNKAWDGDGDILGVVVGDVVPGGEREQILEDAPHNIPVDMYQEASRT